MKVIKIIEHNSLFFVLLAIAVLLGFQSYLVSHYRISVDEFHFLSQVYESERGALTQGIQTVYVHFYSWLTKVHGDEIDKIVAARWLMLIAEAFTVLFIVLSAKVFVPLRYALFAGLAWLTSGFTLTEAFSFRTDPMAAALLMGAVTLSLSTRPAKVNSICLGILLGLACLVTIKSVLYAPAFLAIYWWHARQHGIRPLIAPLTIILSVMLVTFSLVYMWHSAGLAQVDSASKGSLISVIYIAFLETRLFPQINWILAWLVLSFVPVYLMFHSASKNVIAFLFVSTLFCVVVYRNAFEYFFPFISAPAMIAVAIGASQVNLKDWMKLVFGMMMVFSVLAHAAVGVLANQKIERKVLQQVHEIFESPVPYIDQFGMVGSFPRKGFFMTTWGMENYHKLGKPIMSNILENDSPPLLIANHEVLKFAMGASEKEKGRKYLLPDDNKTLRNAYVEYLDNIYIAGFELDLDEKPVLHDVQIAGRYQLESNIDVNINDKQYQNGDIVELGRAEYYFTSSGTGSVKMIWADLRQ